MSAGNVISRLSAVRDGLERLAASIDNAKQSTIIYKRLFRKHFRDKVSPDDLGSRFNQLPFTSKEEVVRNYPNGFLGVPMTDVALYCEPTGTSGNTLGSTKGASFFTAADLDEDLERRFSADLDVQSGDMVDGFEVRRTDDGSVDIAFYVARARQLRAQANVELFRSMRRGMLIVFCHLRRWLTSQMTVGRRRAPSKRLNIGRR